MNVVDSSGWLEYFAGGPNAKRFLAPLKDTESLVVPIIAIYEVFRVVLREAEEDAALTALAAMQKGTVVEMDSKLAVEAARLGLEYGLPMADSIILATARAYDAIVWTQDVDFKGFPGVKYFAKK